MLEQPDQTEEQILPEDLAAFRKEISEIVAAEESGETTTGHFKNQGTVNQEIKLSELGLAEFRLWEDFKRCRAGQKPLEECINELQKYRADEAGQLRESPVRGGFISYVGNKLTNLWGRYQLEEKKRQNMI